MSTLVRPVLGAAVVAAVFFAAGPAAAQRAPEPIPLPEETVEADAERTVGVSPSGAFLRSILVPGWGQAANGAYLRGGIFFGLQSGSWFMLIKTMAKLEEARDMERRRAGIVRDSLLAAAAADPDLAKRYEDARRLELDVQEDERVAGLGSLVRSREKQREDWITMTLFMTLMGGVDAIVNAHLTDFPGRVDVEPVARDRLSVGVTLPVGGSP